RRRGLHAVEHPGAAVRDRAVPDRRPAFAGRRSPGGAAGQPVDLHTDRHAPHGGHDPGAGEGELMQVDFPFHVDGLGRTATTTDDDHIRDLIEQVLFTAPGERVNRPTFGSGLLQLVFAPNSDALAAATQLTVQAALQEWLGDRIEVQDVQVEAVDSSLTATVVYAIRRTQEVQSATFTRQV